MYDTVNSAFSDALKREGKVITAYSDNTPYNVIFRRNSDTNKLQNTITIFYSADSNVHAGQLLKYKDKIYLSINQESAENDTYLKSDLFETNAVMNYIKGGMEFNVPAYAYDVNNAIAINNNVLSIVNGNIELLAEDNSITRALKIDDKFYAIGGYWKINNLIYKDNVIYIYVERETTSTTYTVTITANDSYDRGTTTKLSAIAKADNTVVTNANIVWSSSDESKATITADGKVTFLAEGSVNISALWKEHNATANKSITVTTPAVYSLVINGEDTYLTTDTPTLTATAQKNGVIDTTATITWSSSDTSIATIDNTGKVTFLKDGDVVFTSTWKERNITATKSISITVPEPSTQYTCKITNTEIPPTKFYGDKDELKLKIGAKEYPVVAHFYDSTGTEVTTLTPKWSIDVSSLSANQKKEIHLDTKPEYPMRAYLTLDFENNLIGYDFTLTLIDTDGLCEPKTITIPITGLYG